MLGLIRYKSDDFSENSYRNSEICVVMPAHNPRVRGRRLFFRGTHKVRDDLQLSHFVG